MYLYIGGFILFIVMLIVYLILYANLSVILKYTFSKSEHVVQVTVFFYWFRLLNRSISIVKLDEADIWDLLTNMNGSSTKGKHKVAKLKESYGDLTKLLSTVHIHKLKWNTMVGTGEASTTGLITGGVWTSKGLLFGYLSEKATVECQPEINVIPYYQQKTLQTEIDCIVTIRLGQAIRTYIQSK